MKCKITDTWKQVSTCTLSQQESQQYEVYRACE